MKNITSQLKTISDLDKSTWDMMSFGDVAFNISERVEPHSTDAEIYVGLEHLDADSIHIRRKGKPGDVKGTKLKMYKGDIIFGKRRAYQRKAAISDFDGICSAHAMVLRANPEIINPDLFPFFIHSDVFMNRAIEVSEGSLSPTIKWKILAEQKFRLPPKEIQKKLAEILWAVDEVEERKIDTIERLNISLQSIFLNTYQSKNSKETDLSHIAYINPLVPKDLSDFEGEVDFIPMEAVSEDGELTLGQTKDFQRNKTALTFFQNSDILFAKITPCMENGKGAIVQSLKIDAGIGSTEFHVLRPKKESDLFYIYYLTKMPFFRKIAERHMTGSAGQKRVPTKFLENYKIHLPQESDREKLGNQCHAIWTEKKQHELFFVSTRKLRQSLINSIF